MTKDVLLVQQTVLQVIEKMFTLQLGSKTNKKKSEFSSTDYFFQSTAIAKEFASLDESALVLSFRNAYPNDSLRKQWVGDEPEKLRQQKQEEQELKYKLGHVEEQGQADKDKDKDKNNNNSNNNNTIQREVESMAWKKDILTNYENDNFVDPRSFHGRRIAFMQRAKHSVLRSLRAVSAFILSMLITLGTASPVAQRYVIQTTQPLCIAGGAWLGLSIWNNKRLLYSIFSTICLIILLNIYRGLRAVRHSWKKRQLVKIDPTQAKLEKEQRARARPGYNAFGGNQHAHNHNQIHNRIHKRSHTGLPEDLANGTDRDGDLSDIGSLLSGSSDKGDDDETWSTGSDGSDANSNSSSSTSSSSNVSSVSIHTSTLTDSSIDVDSAKSVNSDYSSLGLDLAQMTHKSQHESDEDSSDSDYKGLQDEFKFVKVSLCLCHVYVNVSV